MSLGPGIDCDAELLETLRLALEKMSPRDLEVYAASTPAFSRGGFRPGNAALVRSRLVAMLASREPVDARLRQMLRDQIRRSLAAGGGSVHLQRELEKAREELARLKGADARLAREGERREQAERSLAQAREALGAAERERGAMRQRAERAEAALQRNAADVQRYCDAIVQTRLSREMAAFLGGTVAGRRETAASQGGVAEKIADAVAAAPDRDLASWKGVVDRLEAAGVFAPGEGEGLRAAVRRRYTRLLMQGLEARLPKDGDPSRPGCVLLRALAGQIPAVLLIDAHNTLFALQSRYRLPNEHRWPTAQTRQWLVDDVVQLVENAPNFRAYVVFDGPERSDASAGPNVQVVYSGGAGEHRADNVLVDQARFLSEAGAQNLLLVTNDGELAGRASRHGAKSLSPMVLLGVL